MSTQRVLPEDNLDLLGFGAVQDKCAAGPFTARLGPDQVHNPRVSDLGDIRGRRGRGSYGVRVVDAEKVQAEPLDLEEVLVDRDGGDAELLCNLGDRGVLVLVELVLHYDAENLALSLREAPQLLRRYHAHSKPGHEI